MEGIAGGLREELAGELCTKWVGRRLCFEREVDSTNLWVKRLAAEGAPEGTVALAEAQKAGRGRRGRSWASPAGENLYLTLLLRPRLRPQDAPMVTLVMGLSVAQGIEAAAGLSPGIKWPNDVALGGRKLCGILTEMSLRGECVDYVAVGVGINVNQEKFPEELADKATSLRREAGCRLRRSKVAAAVLEAFERNFEIYLKTKDLSGLQEEYGRRLINCGRQVRILEEGRERAGTARGINSRGELLVEYEDGSREAVFAGEVSVRGLYSYV